MLKAIIIDDEQHCINRLDSLIQELGKDIHVLARCPTVEIAKLEIERGFPDIIFLDIQIGNDTGFNLLKQLSTIDFEIIFTTSYDSYALKAFKFSALDYLLKPIDKSDFISALQKLRQQKSLKDTSNKIDILLQNIENRESLKKIAIPTIEGFQMLDTHDIVRFQSDVNYTHIFTSTRKKITASKSIKYFEDILDEDCFFRTHKSHLINLEYIDTYTKGKGGYITLIDQTKIEVAVRRKEELMRKLKY